MIERDRIVYETMLAMHTDQIWFEPIARALQKKYSGKEVWKSCETLLDQGVIRQRFKDSIYCFRLVQ